MFAHLLDFICNYFAKFDRNDLKLHKKIRQDLIWFEAEKKCIIRIRVQYQNNNNNKIQYYKLLLYP